MSLIATKRSISVLVAGAVALVIGAALIPAVADAASAVRISQVYGGGGGSSGYYVDDYVELFNNSGSPVNIGGWALMYGSATGTSFGSTSGNASLIPANTMIPACGYFLIRVGTTGTGGLALPVTPDLSTAGPNISASTGKIALVDNQTIPGPVCAGNVMGMEPSPIIDAVGWGPTANCYEASVFATATSNQQAIVRGGDGVSDTDNNSADFSIVTNPVPRNSSSPANTQCLATPNMPGTWGRVKVLYR